MTVSVGPTALHAAPPPGEWGVDDPPYGLCGNANFDTLLNGDDIDPFYLALGGPTAWEMRFPNCDSFCVADINDDRSVNGADIDAFLVGLALGACPCTDCPGRAPHE